MPVADFVKEIEAKKLKAVQDRLKKEKAALKVTDLKAPGKFHTLLHVAVRTGDPAIVNALLAAAADVAAPDNEDSTALHWAAQSNSKEAGHIAEALIKKKAKLDAVNKQKLTPLHIAASTGSLPVVEALLKAGAPVSNAAPGYQPLHAAAHSETKAATKLAIFDQLLAAGATLAAVDSEGQTALMLLVSAGKVAEAQQLMERPACGIDLADPKGMTLLMRAVFAEPPSLDLIRSLVERGACGDLQDPHTKDTAMHVACRRAATAVAEAAAGQQPGAGGGATAAAAAADEALELVRVLMPACRKLHVIKNAKKETAAQAAVEAGAARVALVLLGSGGGGGGSAAVVDLGDSGPALVKAAMDKKMDDVAAKLMELVKPAVVTAMGLDFKGLVATGLGKAAMAYLKRFDEAHSADQPVDDQGNTNLHLLCADGGTPYDVVAAFVTAGLSPSAQNKEGDTPLHVAARAGNVAACRALCEGGADVLRRNIKNRTAGSQLKLSEDVKAYLSGAEEAFKRAKEDKKSALWDDKMKATQTESAFGIRAL